MKAEHAATLAAAKADIALMRAFAQSPRTREELTAYAKSIAPNGGASYQFTLYGVGIRFCLEARRIADSTVTL